jgi:hypothetical protein
VQAAFVQASEKMFDAQQYLLNITPGISLVKLSKSRPTAEKCRDRLQENPQMFGGIVHASIVSWPCYKPLGMRMVRYYR